MEVLAGDDRRVFELLDAGGLERGGAAYLCVGVVGAGGGERGAEAPAGGDGHAGLNGDVADGDVGGIEQELLPLEDGDFVGGARGDDAVEMGVQRGDALGNLDVKLVEVLVVATPVDGLAVDGEDDAGDIGDRAGGAVVAGNPLRGDEGGGAGLDGEIDLRVIELAGSFGEVGGDADGGLAKRRSREGNCGGEEQAAYEASWGSLSNSGIERIREDAAGRLGAAGTAKLLPAES